MTRASRSVPPLLLLAVALLALLPRVQPALRAFHLTPDAAEYLLIARSLSTGQGFTLPIKVRFTDPDSPVVHSAHGERAPLFPLLLSLPARFDLQGWPHPAIQLVNVALAALAAVLATLLGADLARRRGARGNTRLWIALLSGVAVAWLPDFVRASVHLWAEPLGVVLLLAALRHYLAVTPHVGAGFTPAPAPPTPPPNLLNSPTTRALALGLLVGLARFARPEAWVLVPLFLFLLLLRRPNHRRDRSTLAFAAAVLLVNAIGIALTGVLAPQLELFSASHYTELMTQGTTPTAPPASEAATAVLGNALAQLQRMLVPRYAFLLLPLALLGTTARANRPFLLAALALFLSTAVIWSTRDPARFTIAPLCALAPVAATELMLCRRRLLPHSRFATVLPIALWLAVFAQRSVQEAHRTSPPPPEIRASETYAPTLRDPWSYALITGRPAVLLKPPSGR